MDGEKGSMNSRMYSLCKMFPEIEERVVSNNIEDLVDALSYINLNNTINKLGDRCLESKKWILEIIR